MPGRRASTLRADELDALYQRILKEPANTELNLRFARLAEERGTPRWALMAYEQLLVKAVPDLGLVWQYCGVLMLFSAVCFVAGCWRFRYYD